jgi:hypothetical protein
MKLKEYMLVLKKYAKAHPNIQVIYSIDDEGNAFNDVYFHPTLMEKDEYGELMKSKKYPTHICIN